MMSFVFRLLQQYFRYNDDGRVIVQEYIKYTMMNFAFFQQYFRFIDDERVIMKSDAIQWRAMLWAVVSKV